MAVIVMPSMVKCRTERVRKLMINNINIHQPKTKAVVIRKKIISFMISHLLLQLFSIASPSYYSNTLLPQSATRSDNLIAVRE